MVVQSLDGVMLMHPTQPKLVGNKSVSLKDVNGKLYAAVMLNVVREKGEGWVGYHYRKPGTQEFVRKISFCKKCVMANGVEVCVRSGLYNFSEEDVAKLEIN